MKTDEEFAELTTLQLLKGHDTGLAELSKQEYNLLKCTDGLFTGKFFYMNTTPEGEVIGGSGESHVTMQIENANLSPVHCEIMFDQNSRRYKLKDSGSEDGTWVKVF